MSEILTALEIEQLARFDEHWRVTLAGRAAQRSTTSAAELAQAVIASGGRKLDTATTARILGRRLGGLALGTRAVSGEPAVSAAYP